MDTLLKSLRSFATPDLISKASGLLGESESGVSKAFSATFPTMLSGLLYNANNTSVMQEVVDLANDKKFDADTLLGNLPTMLAGSGNTTSDHLGSSMLSSLFGNKQFGVTDLIGNVAGIKNSSAGRVMGYAAPMLLGYIKRRGFGTSDLVKSLMDEKDEITRAAPAGLNALMGYGTKLTGDTREATRDVRYAEPEKSKSRNWIWPLIIALGALILFFGLRNCGSDSTEAPAAIAIDSVKTVQPEERSIPEPSPFPDLGTLMTVTLPNGNVIEVPSNGMEVTLNNWLSDVSSTVDKETWFDFDRLLFATGEATLLPESQEQLRNVFEILNAYPNISVKIGGYTDNTGDPETNRQLSEARANSVMKELIGMGIDPNRLTAEGYGVLHPVASNDTEEGRAQNRRVSLRVIEK